MKRLLTFLALLIAGAAHADVYLALQSDTAPEDTHKTWNSLTDASLTGAIADLDDETGAATGWALAVSNAAEGAGANGVLSVGTGDAAWIDEAIIKRQYHFLDASGDAEAALTFSGLDDGKKYDIEVFANRSTTSGDRITEYSTNGFSTVAGELDGNGNHTETLTIANVSPSSGAITLTWRVKSGSTFAYFNALRIAEKSAKRKLNPLCGLLCGPVR